MFYFYDSDSDYEPDLLTMECNYCGEAFEAAKYELHCPECREYQENPGFLPTL